MTATKSCRDQAASGRTKFNGGLTILVGSSELMLELDVSRQIPKSGSDGSLVQPSSVPVPTVCGEINRSTVTRSRFWEAAIQTTMRAMGIFDVRWGL